MQIPKFNIGDVVIYDDKEFDEYTNEYSYFKTVNTIKSFRIYEDDIWYSILGSHCFTEGELELYQKSPSSSLETIDTLISDVVEGISDITWECYDFQLPKDKYGLAISNKQKRYGMEFLYNGSEVVIKIPKKNPKTDAPIENKHDFGEAIEIVKSIENLCNNNWEYEDGQSHISKERQEALCKRLLSILSNYNK